MSRPSPAVPNEQREDGDSSSHLPARSNRRQRGHMQQEPVSAAEASGTSTHPAQGETNPRKKKKKKPKKQPTPAPEPTPVQTPRRESPVEPVSTPVASDVARRQHASPTTRGGRRRGRAPGHLGSELARPTATAPSSSHELQLEPPAGPRASLTEQSQTAKPVESVLPVGEGEQLPPLVAPTVVPADDGPGNEPSMTETQVPPALAQNQLEGTAQLSVPRPATPATNTSVLGLVLGDAALVVYNSPSPRRSSPGHNGRSQLAVLRLVGPPPPASPTESVENILRSGIVNTVSADAESSAWMGVSFPSWRERVPRRASSFDRGEPAARRRTNSLPSTLILDNEDL
ncbi:hypothetical protein AURDEDRAFT_125998 [Auricularia subglabra TFB-10046 SS5]|nr:hypothetical protein AURDEDRAFT_125998 [Auricularia subglabra TFB-10046 SS5]